RKKAKPSRTLLDAASVVRERQEKGTSRLTPTARLSATRSRRKEPRTKSAFERRKLFEGNSADFVRGSESASRSASRLGIPAGDDRVGGEDVDFHAAVLLAG